MFRCPIKHEHFQTLYHNENSPSWRSIHSWIRLALKYRKCFSDGRVQMMAPLVAWCETFWMLRSAGLWARLVSYSVVVVVGGCMCRFLWLQFPVLRIRGVWLSACCVPIISAKKICEVIPILTVQASDIHWSHLCKEGNIRRSGYDCG